MMDRAEDIYKNLVDATVKETQRQLARSDAQRRLQSGATFEPRYGGTYTADGYRRGWRFGMKLGEEKLLN